MPSGQDAVVGVASVPPVTRKMWVALVSAMKPRGSSMTASSAPATFASILARIEGSRLVWWVFGSRQSGAGRRTRAGRAAQPGQVLAQPEDLPVVEPQAFPDRVAALDGRVERAHPRLVAVAEPAAYVDDEITVTLIEDLQHRDLPG